MLRLTHWHVTLYRILGYHERADAIQRADGGGDAGPSRREDQVDSDYEHGASAGSGGGAPSTSSHNHADVGADAGGDASSGHVDGGGTAAHSDSGDSPSAHASSDSADAGSSHGGDSDSEHPSDSDHAAAHDTAAHDPHAAGGQDPHALPHDQDPGAHDIESNPLGGIRSARLRAGIEREAFQSASSDAQNTAIRTAAFEMLSSVQFPTPPDLSWPAQLERVAALNGDLPGFARGNPQYDPAAPGFIPDAPLREVSPAAPAATHKQALAETPIHATESRTRGIDFER